jgi:formylglycine-generating enzyme required for sulfatase activity
MAAPTAVLPTPSNPAAPGLLPNGATPSPGTVIQDCAECPELVAIPPGEYTMGSSPKEKIRELDEEPAHRVRVTTSLAVGKFEITRAQYAAFVKDTGRESKPGCHSTRGGFFHKNPKATWQNPGFEQKNEEPAVCVSWNDAQAYVAWLSKKSVKQYRLLNESEWEYAARAGSTGRRYWAEADDAATCRYASVADSSYKAVSPGAPLFSCSDGFAHTAPVGRFPANPFGLHDMLGNVWEWVEDCYEMPYGATPVDGSAQLAKGCDRRGARGGAWRSAYPRQRPAFRGRDPEALTSQLFGTRIARDL